MMSCPLLDVVHALTACLQGTDSGSLYCPRAGPTQGVVSCTYEQLEPYSPHIGIDIVSFLFVGTCSTFCILGWVVMACLLLLAV